MLHIVSNLSGLRSFRNFVRKEDAVLYLGNTVRDAREIECAGTYSIECDHSLQITEGIECIDYDEFVELVVTHINCVTWS